MPKQSVTLTLDEDLLDWAREQSEKENRSLSHFVNSHLHAAMAAPDRESEALNLSEQKSIERAVKKVLLSSFARLLDIMGKRNSDHLSFKDIEKFIMEESSK